MQHSQVISQAGTAWDELSWLEHGAVNTQVVGLIPV